MKLTLTRLTSSSAHPGPGSEGTPTDYYKDQAVFDSGAVLFSVRAVKYWKKLPAPPVLSPSVPFFKKQLDRHWSEIFSDVPV